MRKNEKDRFLKTALDRFKSSSSASSENRDSYTDCTAFANGDQWTDEEKVERAGRPIPVINKVAGALAQIKGENLRSDRGVKVRPVDGAKDVPIAEFYNGLIRDIQNVSDADSAYDYGFACAVTGNIGFWRVLTRYSGEGTFDQEIRIERIVNPMSVYMDESATRHDYSDAKYAFICENMDEKEFKRQYPKANPTGWDQGIGEEEAGWYRADGTVRIAEYYYKYPCVKYLFEDLDGNVFDMESPNIVNGAFDNYGVFRVTTMGYSLQAVETEEGSYIPIRRYRKIKSHKVMWAKICYGEILEGPFEQAGKYIPIVPCLGDEVWINGKRVLRSAIYHAKDAAKIYNWARANTMETLALAPKQPYMVTPEEIEGHETQWDNAHKRPQAYRLFNDVGYGRPQPSTPSIPNTGAYREAMVASDDIKATTQIYDASLGARSNETSGRAIAERQAQGSTATYVFVDNLEKAIRYTAKILVDIIPKIYDSQRVVRILGEDGEPVWNEINITDPVTGKIIKNDISVGRYDVVYDSGPNYRSKRIETVEVLSKLAQTAPQYAPILIPNIAKNLDYPGAQEIAQQMVEMTSGGPSPEEQIKLSQEQIKLVSEQLGLKEAELDVILKALQVEQTRVSNDSMMYDMAVKVMSDIINRGNGNGQQRQIGMGGMEAPPVQNVQPAGI